MTRDEALDEMVRINQETGQYDPPCRQYRRPRSIFPSCSRCAGPVTATERHYYGDHCNACAQAESDEWDRLKRQP